MLKTTSRSKCYIEFHSYCLEGEGVSGVLGVPVGVTQPGWSCVSLCPLQRCSGAERTPSRTVTSLGSSSWAGPPSICLWCAALEHPHPHPCLWLCTLSPKRGRSCHHPPGPSLCPLPLGSPPKPLLFAQLNPILPDLEYLGDQHLLLSIKGVESCESFGKWGWWGHHGAMVPSTAPPGHSLLRVRLVAGAWLEGPWHPPSSWCCCSRGTPLSPEPRELTLCPQASAASP